MKQDRFLIGILIGIGALIISALVMFYTRQAQAQYSAGDTPEGAVQNYLLALDKQDYKKAYGYLAADPDKPTLEEFLKHFLNENNSFDSVDVQIKETSVISQNAAVDLVINRSSGRLYRPYSDHETAQLVLENGEWKIREMPYPYWSYDWYRSKSK